MRETTLVLLLVSLCTLSEEQSLLESVLNFVSEGSQQQTSEPPDIPNVLPDYDFIVVGAGTAGCVVANRLTENPEWTVLLIEAGQPENYIMDLPVLANYLQFTDANWKYTTEPSDKYCLAMYGQKCNWPRGKVMGGSSVLNYMIYNRGNRRDYDNWAKLGNDGWSYEDVLYYYKKMEDFQIPEYLNSTYHGTGGYLNVGYAPYRTNLSLAVVEAAQQAGMKVVDYDGPTQNGVDFLHVTMKDGVRHSSSRAYLHPITDRKNLFVKKYSTVKRILINANTREAEGVEFINNGFVSTVRARKEVIISAGAINSPQLLMLSGIGPKKHLTQMGINVLKNLKVGYNLMDHVAAGGLTFTIEKPYSVRTRDFLQRGPLVDYLYYHRGPLTLPGGCEVVIFSDLKNRNETDGYPDMELLYQAGGITSDPVLRRNFGITDAIYDAVFKPIEKEHSFMVLPMLMRPRSKGRIVLKDNNYLTKPAIFPNYYAYQEDLDTMVEGIKLAIEVAKQPAMRAIGTRLSDLPIPGCKQFVFGTNEYWGCHARHFSFTIYHQSGTCKMGPESDKRAVVDPRLRVYGIKYLRVIDASIIPEIPAAHTNGPVFMIAEKGSDMIKEDWGWRP